MKGFTTKRAEPRTTVRSCPCEASAGREPVRGFTLVETMIAVTILTLAVSGAFLAANSALRVSELTRDQLVASYLAQEGIEYVRTLRDDAYLTRYAASDANASDDAWNDFVTSKPPTGIASCSKPGPQSEACQLDAAAPPGTPPFLACITGCGQLYLASTTAYTFQSSGNVLTPYTREIWATAASSTDEQISSKVSWIFHGQTYSVTVTDDLTPWQ